MAKYQKITQEEVKTLIAQYNVLRRELYSFQIHYQILAEYFQTIKADFIVNFIPGQFLNRDLYDSTGPKAVAIMSGVLLGMEWPEGERNFCLELADNIEDTKENRDFINWQGDEILKEMNHPEAGLMLAANEFMRDGVCFGTAGIGVFEAPQKEGYECFFNFQPWDIKRIVIDEGPNGIVNRAYYCREESLDDVAKEFGLENMSQRSQDAYKNAVTRVSQKVLVLHAIEPRYMRDPGGESSFDMPVRSVYIELDGGAVNVSGGMGFGTGAPNDGTVLKESGFEQMRVFVNRFYKNMRERYGRSPAMDALPDVLELNALREAEIVATEKLLDPPLALLDDGRLGADTIDTSAGAINVFNISGRINGNLPPVIQLQTIQDMKSTKDRIEELKQSVSDHFMIDHLLDFNNETEMTLGEVNIREKFRARLLSGMFSRRIVEVWSPMTRCCYNMMLGAGRLGIMPGSRAHFDMLVNGYPGKVIPADIAAAMLRGEHVYEIHYLTPAMRLVQAELMGGILNTWKFANDIAQAQPEIYDNLDEDESIQLVGQYSGAPNRIFRAMEEIKGIRDARAKQQEQQQKFEQQIETMKAMGHLKGLAPQPGAPGVQATPEMARPLQV